METMTKTDHTPGPWRILDDFIICEKVNDFGNFFIASIQRGEAPLTAQDEANAKLIAAAPELLSSIQEIVCGHCFDMIGLPAADTSRPCSFCGPARAAVAKAT